LATLWADDADPERVDSIAFFLVPETCQSERGFRLWPKWPAWGRNAQEPKRHVHVPKRPYINFGELVCRRVVQLPLPARPAATSRKGPEA